MSSVGPERAAVTVRAKFVGGAGPGSIRVGVDGSCFCQGGSRTGVYRYVSELCRVLDEILPEARFFVYLQKPLEHDPGLSDHWMWRVEPVALWRRVKGTVWLKLRAKRLIREDRLDVFWATGTLCPGLPSETKAVVTVYDLNHKLVPKTMRLGSVWSHRLFFANDVLSADAIVTISQGTAMRLKQFLGREASAVVKCAVSPHFQRADREAIMRCREKYGITRPYLLSVATREPRKNLDLLLKTFVSMKGEGDLQEHCLVLAGPQGWKDRHVNVWVERGRACGVVWIGHVADDDLPALYSGADAFVFPSIYEGFGLPVLEARACGAAVVATDIPELREAGGGNTIYIEPTQEGIRAGILSAVAAKRGNFLDGEALWTWKESARTLADLLLWLAHKSASSMDQGGQRGQGVASGTMG